MLRHLFLAAAVSCLLLACGKQDGPQLPSGKVPASAQAPAGGNATQPGGTEGATCPAGGDSGAAGGACC